MSKYKCLVCGYIYDPKLGDPDHDVRPGTAFEKLPDEWVCPSCKAYKYEFEKTSKFIIFG
jgi:rubredoxin